jgi:hypothetical protein
MNKSHHYYVPFSLDYLHRGSYISNKRSSGGYGIEVSVYPMKRRNCMKRGLGVLVLLALLAVPVLVSAEVETIIPPEANWTSTPSVPAAIAVQEKRVAITPQPQEMVSPAPAQTPRNLFEAAVHNTGLIAIANDNDE